MVVVVTRTWRAWLCVCVCKVALANTHKLANSQDTDAERERRRRLNELKRMKPFACFGRTSIGLAALSFFLSLVSLASEQEKQVALSRPARRPPVLSLTCATRHCRQPRRRRNCLLSLTAAGLPTASLACQASLRALDYLHYRSYTTLDRRSLVNGPAAVRLRLELVVATLVLAVLAIAADLALKLEYGGVLSARCLPFKLCLKFPIRILVCSRFLVSITLTVNARVLD